MPEFELAADDTEAAQSLLDHLRAESLTGVRVASVPATPRPDTLGVQEVIEVLVTSGTGIALAQAVKAWVTTRRRHVRLTIRRKSDGTVLELDATGPDSLAALDRFLDDD